MRRPSRRGRERIRDGLTRRAAKLGLDQDETGRLGGGSAGPRPPRPDGRRRSADDADLVIEAALEDLALKRTIFRTLDDVADASVILATNTSALSVAEIAEATRRPERVIGLHFFNPAPVMALVEVVAPPLADPAVVARAVATVTAWGKTPVVCADRPGFIVNRVNRPFTIEALRILEAGAASVSEIDEAMRDGGFPMGPFELMDLIGIDVNLAAATGIWEGLGRPDRLRPSPIQEALVAAGDLGRKTGQGFYRYEDGRRIGEAGGPPTPASAERLTAGASGSGSSTRSPTRHGWPPRKASPRPTSSISRCDSVPATRMGRSSRDRRHPDGRTSLRAVCRGRPTGTERPTDATIGRMTRDSHRPLREAWIVEAVRTPIGRYGGALASVRPDDLAAAVLRGLVDRAGIDPALVEDVILGCANQAGEDNRDVARMALLLADFPVEVGGLTVNRLCGSGLQAINSAAHAIAVGDGDVFIGGGVESMTRAPYVQLKAESAFDRGNREMADTTLGWRFVNPRLAERHYPYSMGETAENVAERWGVSRERQDAFALESQRRAVAAIEAGRFADQIVPISVPQRKGEPLVVDRDEHPRADPRSRRWRA